MHPDGKAHGGTAPIIRGDIRQYKIGKYQRVYLQATNIVIEKRKGCLIILAVYSLPKHSSIKEILYNFF